MEENEVMGGVNSESNGLMTEETPSEAPVTETPAETVEAVPATEPVKEELFELPDGRKVDAVTLTKEWKENFLPDYTRKSQALAQKAPETITTNEPAKNPLEDPEWQPKSYAELIEIAKLEMKSDIQKEQQQIIEAQQQREEAVINQLTEVKKLDPAVNETQLFLHATKYKFQDLTLAHQNMKDMADLAKKVQQTTATNIQKRNDPVSVSPGATGTRSDPSQFGTAREYLRSLNT